MLTYFHMYWRIRVLQDTKMENVENIIKVRNQAKRKEDLHKESGKGPLSVQKVTN